MFHDFLQNYLNINVGQDHIIMYLHLSISLDAAITIRSVQIQPITEWTRIKIMGYDDYGSEQFRAFIGFVRMKMRRIHDFY